jgi:antitoxin component of MazEF toxin-antitoxin module
MKIIKRIETIEGQAVLIVPPEFLEEMGLAVGDEVALTVVDRTLIVQPTSDKERARRIADLSDGFVRDRRTVYESLAKGE